MTTLGIIGSGNIGSTVARLAVRAGHHVVLSNSRGPDSLAELVAELGPLARAATRDEAAAAGEILLVSIPIKAYPSLSDVSMSGKVVMDTGNYYPGRDGEITELADKSLTDSEYLVRFLPGVQVVKVFNNIFYKTSGILPARRMRPVVRCSPSLAMTRRRKQLSSSSWIRSATRLSMPDRSQTVGDKSPAHRCMDPLMGPLTTRTVRQLM